MVLRAAAAVGCMCVGGALVMSPWEAEDGRRHGQAQGWLEGMRSWERVQRPSLNLTLGAHSLAAPTPQGYSHCLGFGNIYTLQGRRGEGQQDEGGSEAGSAKAL